MGALLDTSIFVAREAARHLREVPEESSISVVTLAELRLGVLMATTPEEQTRRLATMNDVERAFEALDVDDEVASAYATAIADARRVGRRLRPFDGLIAATAIANGMTLYTQDNDFVGLPGLDVVVV